MPAGSGSKRERQYEDVKDGARGGGGKRAKGTAAHTAGGERARGGGAKPSGGPSRGTPARDASSSKPGGQRSRGGDSGGATYEELYAEARKRDIPGRSSMNKAELRRKLGR
ncbi:plasmid stabilization protein [Streptomyces somaliensis]|uniref:Plasmid stabilization protein n=1 Tax=Streptomyces somaliensis (strain ATCC 33201 / DSM 40738 / JCM 12659 / KCTC 9044 / NCTC 11332 / NRRL B-12077 / IP 733) TaxID=1134445 RepID=A0AA44IDU5_STRE0|nr:plasmid stabilization protein [Streptomyces somaliensis]NKY15084.1 plasmid stabilization protein [Streptomyces somaliensis DSM 40738]